MAIKLIDSPLIQEITESGHPIFSEFLGFWNRLKTETLLINEYPDLYHILKTKFKDYDFILSANGDGFYMKFCYVGEDTDMRLKAVSAIKILSTDIPSEMFRSALIYMNWFNKWRGDMTQAVTDIEYPNGILPFTGIGVHQTLQATYAYTEEKALIIYKKAVFKLWRDFNKDLLNNSYDKIYKYTE
jgi:hypothetical protein